MVAGGPGMELASTTAVQRGLPWANVWGLVGVLRQPLIWIGIFAFALYLPPAVTVLQLGPDTVEFLELGQRLAAGQGYLLGTRSAFYWNTDVLHNGLEERAPLYPFVVAALLRLGLGLHAAQVVNAALAAGSAALVCAIGTRVAGKTAGILAGLLAAVSPPMPIHMVLPNSEALAIFLALLATWLFVRHIDRGSVPAFAIAGAALGLGYLTRPVTAALALALILGALLASSARRRLWQPMVALLVAMTIFVAPITLYSLATRGSLSYSGQTYLYSVLRDTEATRNVRPEAYGNPLPPPTEFVLTNRDRVAQAMLENIRDYAGLVFLDRKWLLPLLPAWPLAIFALIRGRYPRTAWLVLLLAAANFFAYALTWANHERRYQLLTLLLLLPFAVDGLSRLGLPRIRMPLVPRLNALHLAIVAIVVFWSPTFVEQYGGKFREAGGGPPVGTRSYQGLRWTGPAHWVEDDDLTPVIRWVSSNTGPDDVLAHAYPWPVTFFSGRLGVRLPRTLDELTFKRFVVDYRVAYVLLNNFQGYRGRFQDDLMALEPEGVRVTAIGDYRVFDTRALWSYDAATAGR
jgi:hypothetical protein